jgi:limonene-1,2-epoxide hydrolase
MSNPDRIRAFYRAFEQLDGEAMQAAYADDAQFDDEAFSLKGAREIGGMWRMLCETVKAKGRDDWKLVVSDITANSAHWEPTYRFSATGRLVHNIIDAEFSFAPDGRILRHRDRFDFWRWSRQALGAPGLLLGWSPFLRSKVRAQAKANLQRYLAKSA